MRLAMVLADRMLAASAMLPMEMWRAAASTAQGRGLHFAFEVDSVMAHPGKSVSTQAGIDLVPSAEFAHDLRYEVIYLPALWRNPRPVLARSQPLTRWLQSQYEAGALIAAVGTGCCFLAEAGLLDGKSATTHWHYFEQFARDYPRVQLKRQYFITQAGSLFCAGSVNAMADVTVHLIERFFGRAIATHVERNFSHEIRRPFEKTRFLDGDDLQHADELIVEVQLTMQRRLQEPLRMQALAREFDLSPRSLDRRFREATGSSPLAYLQQQRIKAAKALLESTNLTLAEIAYRVGYLDQGHFARLFERTLLVAPRAYRRTVRAKIFAVEPG
ncbi:MAG: helix-turn-helix domain-containing protein [Gammaproteobacteria bacterium]|nr:helix-turn-helix domain-containing protein [Gammaproteobacteria bacterium]